VANRFQAAACIWLMLLSVSWAETPSKAWPGKHPLSLQQTGELLLSELRCGACHLDVPRSSVPEKTAPDLSEVGARVSPEFLRQYLASPASAHPGTSMPDLLAAKPAAEQQQIALALTHFLVAQAKSEFSPESSPSVDVKQGQALFHSVGCVACHGPKELPPMSANADKSLEADDEPPVATNPTQPFAVPLNHVATKYSAKSLGEFLFQPLRVRNSGRMPDMKLTPAEANAIAGYLRGAAAPTSPALVPEEKLVAEGKKYYQQLNCAACHALPGFEPAARKVSLKQADFSRGCLSGKSERSPQFKLNAVQQAAIKSALQTEAIKTPDKEADKLLLAQTLTTFRCIACHVRDDYGGVHDTHNPYFLSSEQKLGDDGRIPPPLTLIGAKLQPAWLKKVLFDGESVRHYMATRMPQYGSANLEHLPAVVDRLDQLTGQPLNIPTQENRTPQEREREKLLRAAGRELLGEKGVNCVACHTFNGKSAQQNQGIDLLTSYQRLEPVWFNLYLRNPGAFRPRTVMPTAWPNGQASFKTILEGNTDQQIEAIWYYLSLGTSAADPPGVRAVNTKLAVADRAVIHRGRSRVAGYRGIAVGLPEQLHYAFNAETGTLSALWSGDFINVNWSGQGSGDFNPASNETITLPQDVSFAPLANEQAAWPLLPIMTKEARTNPNPLYPKNVGYQFRGYWLDERDIPTFQYQIGSVEIDDRASAEKTDQGLQLKRVLTLVSPTEQTLWFRALTGSITQESEQVYRSGRLRLKIPAIKPLLRSLSQEEPKQSELLLRLQLPVGKTSLEFIYEPLPK
jgi:mono/diheme cytochrome c family protein